MFNTEKIETITKTKGAGKVRIKTVENLKYQDFCSRCSSVIEAILSKY